MSLSKFENVGARELELFLEDVRENIGRNDDTDFKKLVLYLLGFLNSKLCSIKSEQNVEDEQLINKLIETIEYVFNKRPSLMLGLVSKSESLSVGINSDSFRGRDSCEVYEYALMFILDSIKAYMGKNSIATKLKSLGYEIVDQVCSTLRIIKYRKKLKDIYMIIFERDLNVVLAIFHPSNNSKHSGYYIDCVVRCVHIFSSIYNHTLVSKLMLNNNAFEMKIEDHARKLWYIINSIHFKSFKDSFKDTEKVLDELRSILVLDFTSFLLLKHAVSWSQIKTISNWFSDYLETFLPAGFNSPIPFSSESSIIICRCMLRIFHLAGKLNFIDSFLKLFQLNSLIDSIADPLCALPEVAAKTLHLMNYHRALRNNDVELILQYKSSGDISAPFFDYELDNIKLELNKVSNCNIDTSLIAADILSFHEKPMALKFCNNGNFDTMSWLRFTKNVLFNDLSNLDSVNVSHIYTLITSLGHLPCLVNKDYDFGSNVCSKCSTNSLLKVSSSHIDSHRKLIKDEPEINYAYKNYIIEFLLKNRLDLIRNNSAILSNLLLTVWKFFATFRPSITSFNSDPVFALVMDSLVHESREVRLLAARILPLYLIAPKDQKLEDCFKLIFFRVTSIKFESDTSGVNFAESTTRALGEMAIISEGEWSCVLLIKMVDLLGESKEHNVNFIYNELLIVAAAKFVTPYKLLSPFLPSIAERIVKQPRLFQRITELLGISKKYFLSRTKEYTTPMFLEYYKHDFIQEIAQASNTTKWRLIAKNLPRIIATYLCKDEEINEKYITSVLRNASPEYAGISFHELFSSIGEITWFTLLQIHRNEEGTFQNEKRITNALTFISKMNLSRSGKKETSRSIDFNYIENLLGDHVLELIQRFSENVHHMRGTKPYLEKVASLVALEFIISKNPRAVTSALGQISTCLQASLENIELELAAIQCWRTLMNKLSSQDLLSLFDITISVIFQRFPSLEHQSRIVASDILKRLFSALETKNSNYSLYYFSVPFIERLDGYFHLNNSIRNMRKAKSKINYFKEFSRRINTNNKYIVKQALEDLVNYITKYQEQCQSDDFKDSNVRRHVSEVLRSLLDTAAHFRNEDPSIAAGCAKALAVFGALDPNRFNIKSIDSHIIILFDFEDYSENADFLHHFIEEKVIKIFWSSDDPVKQLFSAYSMQKFLEVLELGDGSTHSVSQDTLTKSWNMFSDFAKSTLTPLLSSKYVSPVSKFEPVEFPIYKHGISYEKWLMDLTLNLLKRPSKSIFDSPTPTKDVIFQACSMLVRNNDTSLCSYLLKYAALSNIITGDKIVFSDLKIEFLNILEMNCTNLSTNKIELLKYCFQTVLEVLDYFNVWVSNASRHLNEFEMSRDETTKMRKRVILVKSFLEEIPMQIIALKSAACDSYERTILYLEKCFKEDHEMGMQMMGDNTIISTLTEVYANINDYDSLTGILQKFATNNLAEKLSTFKYNDDWTLAQASFEVLGDVRNTPEKISNNTKLLKSLYDHALYEEVFQTLADRTQSIKIQDIPLQWSMIGIQAAIATGNIERIKRWVFVTDLAGKPQDVETMTDYQFAKKLQSVFAKRVSSSDVSSLLSQMYETIGTSLVSSKSSSFSRNSNLMVQLHALYDFGLILAADLKNDHLSSLTVENILKHRLSNVDQTFDVQWKVLNTHKLAYSIRKDDSRTAELLLSCSKVARKNHRLDISTKNILRAMSLNEYGANIEFAELQWAQGKQTEAIQTLRRIAEGDKFKNSHQKATVQLQYATWLNESNHSASSDIISEYIKAYELESSWEKPYYELGKYYVKIMESNEDKTGFFELQIIRFFLKSLACGPTYIFEALPKFITIWLDFAQKPLYDKEAEKALSKITSEITSYVDDIPIYVWYTSLTQILSRIVHSHSLSAQILFKIVFKIVKAYPKHSLWYVLSHLNSNDSIRKSRVSGILKKISASDVTFSSDLKSARSLFGSLIKVASFKIQKKSVKKMSLSKDFGASNLFESYESLVIPVRSNLEISLPSNTHLKVFSDAFPMSSTITFQGFEDLVNVFHSLQMPRQLIVRGSNGLMYRLMVKKDDTRKDAKVVEFTTMINRLLSMQSEARKRNLFIANYSVISLAENIGVIEFVQDVATMKSVVAEQRRRLGTSTSDRKHFMKLDEAQKSLKSSNGFERNALNSLVKIFEDICQNNPPVLHSWYVEQFSNPRSWYEARNAFVRSSAVMSIVGYIIGLGDRHCENILIFKTSGNVLHIDFDCLFEKGKSLPTPEIVPFRLTQNMIDAMSISGIEGSFRITCEVTASILRENEAPLMNILETLIYDPLLDWKALANPHEHLKRVQKKIRGLLSDDDGIPMNIHGQIDVLIQEAVAKKNLAQMYGGWAPYI